MHHQALAVLTVAHPAGSATTSAARRPPSLPFLGVPLLLLLVALAGCTGPAAPLEVPAPAESAEVPASTVAPAASPTVAEPANAPRSPGRLLVAVHGTDGAPVAGARVEVGALANLTDMDGVAVFPEVAPGRVAVRVAAEGFRPATGGALVRPRDVAESHVTLLTTATAPAPVAEEDGVLRYRFQGHYTCTATYLIVTGDCFALLDALGDRVGLPVTAGDASSEAYQFDLPLDFGWAEVEASVTWEDAEPGQERMLLTAGPVFWTPGDHPPRYASVEGGAPLHLLLEAGLRHASATTTAIPEPLGGDVLRLRLLPLGYADRPAETRYLGVGASVDHAFVLEVAVRGTVAKGAAD